jgi:alpha-amylase/alpha-mannosidase (GH57 family)
VNRDLALCLHGHFYQPPRENAWIEEIEAQESAHPFHDWNEKIHYECYLPNAKSRILDKKGHIVNIVNNFEMISFNFGPTLLAWLEKKYPETYRLILEADRTSRAKHGGSGNAIATVYNHMILPLASRRDKVTQIAWGLCDFQYRFGRNPESIWLPETACNEETLEVLAEQGVKFIILSPYQAEAVSPLGEEKWEDVSRGTIDPKMPYRCFLRKDAEKYIDVFFYDGPISKDVGFGDLAFDAKRLMDRVDGAKNSNGNPSQLVHIATDGETYGHHKPFGDRVLAYIVAVEAEARGYRTVNYAEFLRENPPRFAVRLKEGENGEGTSWSCVHGVARWKEDCGCRGAGPAEWKQHWRKPLREALDWLRDRTSEIYESWGGRHLKDVWEARNDYIEVIFDRKPDTIRAFFERHAKKELAREELTLCLKLLEIERHAMLMYTSCGWFFTELSGIETVQILQYAARAVQLVEEVTQHPMEEDFLERLAQAKSNVPEFKDGRTVYEKLVKPSVTSLPKVVAHYGMASIFEEYGAALSMHCFKLDVLYRRQETYGNLTLNFGRVRIASAMTLEERDLVFLVLQFGGYDFRCSVKPFADLEEFKKIERDLFDGLYHEHVVELLRKADEYFGKSYYALKDMLVQDRTRIISILTHESIEKISDGYDQLFEENRRMSEIYRSINLPIPEEVQYAAEHALNRRLRREIEELAKNGFDEGKLPSVYRVIEIAKQFRVTLKGAHIAPILNEELAQRTRELAKEVNKQRIRQCFLIQEVARRMNVELDKHLPQDDVFFLLKKWSEQSENALGISEETMERIFELAVSLGINPDEFRKGWLRHRDKAAGERKGSAGVTR